MPPPMTHISTTVHSQAGEITFFLNNESCSISNTQVDDMCLRETKPYYLQCKNRLSASITQLGALS